MRQEIMEARKYLSQIKRLELQKVAAIKRLDAMEKSIVYISGIRYDRERVQSSRSGEASYERAVLNAQVAEQETRELIVQAETRRQRIITQIYELTKPEHAKILFQRYVEGKTCQEIADEVFLSEQWIRHQASDALEEFYDRNEQAIKAYTMSNGGRHETDR